MILILSIIAIIAIGCCCSVVVLLLFLLGPYLIAVVVVVVFAVMPMFHLVPYLSIQNLRVLSRQQIPAGFHAI